MPCPQRSSVKYSLTARCYPDGEVHSNFTEGLCPHADEFGFPGYCLEDIFTLSAHVETERNYPAQWSGTATADPCSPEWPNDCGFSESGDCDAILCVNDEDLPGDCIWPPGCATNAPGTEHEDTGWVWVPYHTFPDVGGCWFEREALACPADYPYFYPDGAGSGICIDEDCGEDAKWCEATCECVDTEEPPCADELNCRWDYDTCAWECDDPETLCAEGETWNYTRCRCEPDCPEGEQYCIPSNECVEAPDPECKDELHCTWNPDACAWICDNSETICGPTREWLGTPDCRCEGSGGVWNLHTPIGHYHVADDLSGIRYRRAEDTVPPFTLDVAVTADTTDRSPRMVRDADGRIILLWLRGTDCYQALSDDEGETWSTATIIHMATTQVTIAKDRTTGMILRGYLVSNELIVTRQYPGEAAESADIPAMLHPGPVALELDDAGFHFSHAPEGPGRWLLAGVVSGAAANFASADDGETWENVD